MKNADMPAMPLTGDAYTDFAAYNPDKNDSSYNPECQGLTKREQFCLKMGIPETGDKELDAIIRKGNKQKFAAMAMQGSLAAGDHFRASKNDIAETAIEYADAVLKELGK